MMKHLLTIFLTFTLLNCLAQAPVVNSILGSSVICSSPSAASSFTASATNSPTSYTWSVIPSNGAIITNGSGPVANISFPYSNGYYTIYCQASNAFGTSNVKSFVVSVFETPTVNFSGATTFCQGSSTNLSASSTVLAASPTISYSWLPTTGLNTSIGPNVTAFPSVPTSYTVTAVKGACTNTAQILVAPFQFMSVTFSGATTFCQGSSTSISASSTLYSGSSTIFYSWSPGFGLNTIFGPNVIANPSVPTTYTVTASLGGQCSHTGQITIGPNNLAAPSITAMATPSLVCYGGTTMLNAFGANTYTWSNNIQSGVPFNAYYSTTYYVYGTGANGCIGTASVNVNINNSASFFNTTTSNQIPVGGSATLSIIGNAGSTYSLNGISTPTTFVLSPTITTNYTITSINSSGCSYTLAYTQFVGVVSNIQSIGQATVENYLNVFPNPSNGVFTIKSTSTEKINIINQLGEVVMTINLEAGTEGQISGLSAGIYFIQATKSRTKIIVLH